MVATGFYKKTTEKTMNEAIKRDILKKIESYETIIIIRHIRPDGDAVGSTLGLREILRLTYPEKRILCVNEDYSEYMAFLGNEDQPIKDEEYANALVIAIDTASTDRLSNKKFALGKELIKIDHHIDIAPYGDLSWVEDFRSSACEMIADFYNTHKNVLKINSFAATCIYAGMVTDTGRFKYEVSGETMRLAGVLLDIGIDTETLYAHLTLEDFDYYKFEAYIFSKIKMTENGVAYLYVTKAMKQKLGLSNEQASSAISFIDSIKGSLIWAAFIDNDDGTIRVRLRSRFLDINTLAERFHGGGHAKAAGATCYSKKEMNALIAEADTILKEYKETHENWL